MKKRRILILIVLHCIAGSLWSCSSNTSITLEADAVKYLETYARAKDDTFFKVLAATAVDASSSNETVIDIFKRKFQQIAVPHGKKLLDYYDVVDTRSDDNAAIEYLGREIQEATARSVAIIRERIVQSGYGEPRIEVLTPYRVTIEVPEALEEGALQKLFVDGQLEFRLQKDSSATHNILDRINRYVAGIPQKTDPITDSLSYVGLTQEEMRAKYEKEYPLWKFIYQGTLADGRVYALDENRRAILDIITRQDVKPLYEHEMGINFSRAINETAEPFYEMYFLEPIPELTGDFIADAKSGTRYKQPIVSVQMDDEGTRIWSRITDKNINKQIAIMVDNVVYAAPTIRSRIEGGACEIAGIKDSQEAELLAILLKTGGLPVSMKIVGE